MVARVLNLRIADARPHEQPPGVLTAEQQCRWDQLTGFLGARAAVLRVAQLGGETVGHALTFVRITPEVGAFLSQWQEPELGERLLARRAALLTDVMVREGYRRLGIGAELVLDAARLAADAGFERLFLHVHADNVPARGLYRRLGFTEEAGAGETLAYTLELSPPARP